jgi:hypothetical protein
MCEHTCEEKKKKNKKKLSNHRCSCIPLECARPCAGGERAIAMYSKNRGVVCEQWYEYTTYTTCYSKCREEKERRNKLWASMKKKELDASSIIEKKEKRRSLPLRD